MFLPVYERTSDGCHCFGPWDAEGENADSRLDVQETSEPVLWLRLDSSADNGLRRATDNVIGLTGESAGAVIVKRTAHQGCGCGISTLGSGFIVNRSLCCLGQHNLSIRWAALVQ